MLKKKLLLLFAYHHAPQIVLALVSLMSCMLVSWCFALWCERMRRVVDRKNSLDYVPYKPKCFFAVFRYCVASECSPHLLQLMFR